VVGAQPGGRGPGEPFVRHVPARLDRVQVAEVRGDPPPEFRPVADVAMTGHDDPHPRDGRQHAQPVPVAAERVGVGRLGAEQRYLHVGAHVPGDEHSGVRQEHRAVSRRVRVVREHDRARTAPRKPLPRLRPEPREQGQVMPGRGLFHLADQAGQVPFRRRHGARGGVPHRVAERPAPQHVVPVRVRRPARHRAQPARGQPGRERVQVSHRDGWIDDQAAAVGPGDNRGRRHVEPGGRHEDAGRHLIRLSHAAAPCPRCRTPHSSAGRRPRAGPRADAHLRGGEGGWRSRRGTFGRKRQTGTRRGGTGSAGGPVPSRGRAYMFVPGPITVTRR
jgi:hypothetical protein